jgi:cobalamin biosynthetic protein CobC
VEIDPQLLWHGGQIRDAARVYPLAPRPWLDLSTGIAPWAYPVGEMEEQAWQALPARADLASLEAAAARSFGMVGDDQTDQIAAVPGSDLALRLLAPLLPAARVAIVGQSYAGYRQTWPEARILPFEKATNADLMICANPNNPDGAVISRNRLQRLRNLRVVDEAFADALPHTSLLPHRNGAVVLRSFGKFFGLAGIRLGFVVADRPFIRALRAMRGDWPITGPAITLGTRAYQDADWQTQQRERLTTASTRMQALLIGHGLTDAGGTANFRLVTTPDAASLFNHLCRSGILVRPFADRPDALRFGLPGTATGWERLERALTRWREEP